MKGYYGDRQDRFESINRRNFKSSLIRMMETNYKLIGSRRVLEALADDVEEMIAEHYPKKNKTAPGFIHWVTTSKKNSKPSYGKRTEDYESIVVNLPLISEDDVNQRTFIKAKSKNESRLKT